MHVVIPGGIKFMLFLLKVIVLVVNETLARKKATDVEVKKPVGEYICKDLKEKSEFVTALGVDIKKVVAEDVAVIKKKIEFIDMAIGTVFDDVTVVEEGDRKEFFDSWSKTNFEKFKKIQTEQTGMKQTITAFAGICKHAQNLLKPQEFTQPIYNSVVVKEAIKIIKDKTGYVDESGQAMTPSGYTDVAEVIKLIRFSIEPVIGMIVQYPQRDLSDIKADAVVMNELFTKTMSVSSELKSFLKKMSHDSVLHKTEVSIQNVVHDPQLLSGFFGTPSTTFNTKVSEDLSMLNMPFSRIGAHDVTRMNFSPSRILQMSQRELLFSPKLEKSMLAPLNPAFMKPSRPITRKFQINSASLFAPKDSFPLDTYSMVMPGSANVFSSTVLDQTIRNQTPPTINIGLNVSKPTGSEFMSVSPFNETQIPKHVQGVKTPFNPKKCISPQPKRLSINAILTPRIQLNDQTLESTSSLTSLTIKSASPSSRIKTYESLLTNSDSSFNDPVKQALTIDGANEESPNTVDMFSKFNNINFNEEKENLSDISGSMLVNDSM